MVHYKHTFVTTSVFFFFVVFSSLILEKYVDESSKKFELHISIRKESSDITSGIMDQVDMEN